MPYYEHIFIARQDISPAQVEGLTETLAQIVKENGGKIEKSEYWGLRNLQYKINKNRKGHYSLFNIDGPPAVVQELERQEKQYGLVTMCAAGGMAPAMIVERVDGFVD